MNEKNMNNSAAFTEEERRKMRRAALVKMAAMLVFVIVVMIFGSIAWFTMNKDVSNTGMGVKIGSDAYQIVPVDGIDSIYQDYYKYIENYSSDALVWKMNDESNMENFTGDVGISPGSFGTISFYVQPRDESINLDLTFNIVGYEYKEETEETGTQKTTRTMTIVSDELQNYLSGHLFLFQKRDPVYDNPDDSENRKIISYIYSDPILSGADLSKVISNRTFTRTNQNTPVNIYWVWPKTLSTLVDATANANVSIEPFSNGTDRTAIINNIAAYPAYYFYNSNDSATTLATLHQSATPAKLMSDEYDTYGDLYDRVDNEVGLKVSYITLKMTSSEAAATTATTTSSSTTTTTTTTEAG